MSLDDYRERERQMFSNSREAYIELFDEKLAKDNELRGKRPSIKIPETTFAEHLAANWNLSDDYLHAFVDDWYKQKAVVESPDGGRTFLLDTNDFVELNIEDTAFFYMIDSCFAIVIDLVDSNDVKRRIAYHTAGSLGNKELALEVLLQKLEVDRKVTNVVVMANSKRDYGKIKIDEL